MTARQDGWWSRATQDQKLAQIDGGIECGMTARQVATASGMDKDRHPQITVLGLALRHGRKFKMGALGLAWINRNRSASAAYFRGEPVDFRPDGIQDRSKPVSDDPQELVFK